MSATTRPVRLQLSRRKGFDLQALSLATNGLSAVNVARPGRWGNPFLIHPGQEPGRQWHGAASGFYSVPTRADAVACFAEMMRSPGEKADALRAALPELRGKNLACWCGPDEECHADVLLALANGDDDEDAA